MKAFDVWRLEHANILSAAEAGLARSANLSHGFGNVGECVTCQAKIQETLNSTSEWPVTLGLRRMAVPHRNCSG